MGGKGGGVANDECLPSLIAAMNGFEVAVVPSDDVTDDDVTFDDVDCVVVDVMLGSASLLFAFFAFDSLLRPPSSLATVAFASGSFTSLRPASATGSTAFVPASLLASCLLFLGGRPRLRSGVPGLFCFFLLLTGVGAGGAGV